MGSSENQPSDNAEPEKTEPDKNNPSQDSEESASQGSAKSKGKFYLPFNRLRVSSFAVITTFFATIFVTVIIPGTSFRPQSDGRENYYTTNNDGDAARGRQVYIREGCVYCHSQYVRLQDRGLGPVSRAGDFLKETPNLLGTARTGPDLSNEGGKFSSGWQRAHLINPRTLKPGSIMPSFSYLTNRDLDDLVAYIQSLGNKRIQTNPYAPPEEYDKYLLRNDPSNPESVDTKSPRSVHVGKGLYTQNCAACHGLLGQGNGTAAVNMVVKPTNFTLPQFNTYSDLYWFYRITEGVPGSGMPRWGDTLTEKQRWYLVAYLKTLPSKIGEVPVLDRIEALPTEMRHTHQQWDPPLSDQ